jgi:hypothetical protein
MEMGKYPDFGLRIMGFLGEYISVFVGRAAGEDGRGARILVFPSSTIRLWLRRSDDLLCAKSRLFRRISIRLELSSVSYSWKPVRVGTQVEIRGLGGRSMRDSHVRQLSPPPKKCQLSSRYLPWAFVGRKISDDCNQEIPGYRGNGRNPSGRKGLIFLGYGRFLAR